MERGGGRALALLTVAIFAAACGEGAERVCRVDGDCASGHCRADGTCGDYQVGDGQAVDSGVTFGVDAAAADGASADAASDVGAGAGADAGAADAVAWTCAPNHDGRVDRVEVRFAAGLSAPFRVARDATFDAKGSPSADGEGKVWDLVGPFAGDEDVAVQTLPVAGAWYADAFPGATYAAVLDTGSPLLGVFEATGDSLLLRGVVSPKDGLLRTKLRYDPPAVVLSFPLEAGASFQSSSIVDGEKDGVMALWNETWVSAVDGDGVVKTPYGNFPALRVRTTLTRKVGLYTFVTRSLAWVAECFGTVASARSKLNEGAVDFGKADELRRLAPP